MSTRPRTWRPLSIRTASPSSPPTTCKPRQWSATASAPPFMCSISSSNPRLDRIRRAIDTAGAEGAQPGPGTRFQHARSRNAVHLPVLGAPVYSFLPESCQGISTDMAETAELIVSENRYQRGKIPGDLARILQYSERASASLIVLSLRNCREELPIERFTIQTAIRRYYPAPMTTCKRLGPDARRRADLHGAARWTSCRFLPHAAASVSSNN